MTTTASELEAAAHELDELIATETVRARHVALVRLRSRVTSALDNLITPQTGDAE